MHWTVKYSWAEYTCPSIQNSRVKRTYNARPAGSKHRINSRMVSTGSSGVDIYRIPYQSVETVLLPCITSGFRSCSARWGDIHRQAVLFRGFSRRSPNSLFGDILKRLFGNFNGEPYSTLYSARPTWFLRGHSVHQWSDTVLKHQYDSTSVQFDGSSARWSRLKCTRSTEFYMIYESYFGNFWKV